MRQLGHFAERSWVFSIFWQAATTTRLCANARCCSSMDIGCCSSMDIGSCTQTSSCTGKGCVSQAISIVSSSRKVERHIHKIHHEFKAGRASRQSSELGKEPILSQKSYEVMLLFFFARKFNKPHNKTQAALNKRYWGEFVSGANGPGGDLLPSTWVLPFRSDARPSDDCSARAKQNSMPSGLAYGMLQHVIKYYCITCYITHIYILHITHN